MMNPCRWRKAFKHKGETIGTLDVNLKGDLNNMDYHFILFCKRDTQLLGQELRKELIKDVDFIPAANVKRATY